MPWSQESREAARQRCLARRPSQFSTGPKTAAGKTRSSLNAMRHGIYSRLNVVRHSARLENLAQQQSEAAEGLRALLQQHGDRLTPKAVEILQKISTNLDQTN